MIFSHLSMYMNVMYMSSSSVATIFKCVIYLSYNLPPPAIHAIANDISSSTLNPDISSSSSSLLSSSSSSTSISSLSFPIHDDGLDIEQFVEKAVVKELKALKQANLFPTNDQNSSSSS